MFLGEHVLYGSSRLGTSTYNQKMGYASGSLAYPAGPGFNVCYTESDEVESDREPMGGQTTGPIGGGTMETIKPYGPHKVPGTRVPIVGVNLPWAGDDHDIKPTKQPTTFVPGRKRYEFSNHLGNVLVTVSDKPLGVDGNLDGFAEYYMPDVKTTSDYEPFGAPLKERTFAESSTYRFGFNGQEKENDLYGEGNAVTFEYRVHDARIGRFLSVDPLSLEYPWNSTYAFAENMVISCIDLEGLEAYNRASPNTTRSYNTSRGTYRNVGVFNPTTQGNRIPRSTTRVVTRFELRPPPPPNQADGHAAYRINYKTDAPHDLNPIETRAITPRLLEAGLGAISETKSFQTILKQFQQGQPLDISLQWESLTTISYAGFTEKTTALYFVGKDAWVIESFENLYNETVEKRIMEMANLTDLTGLNGDKFQTFKKEQFLTYSMYKAKAMEELGPSPKAIIAKYIQYVYETTGAKPKTSSNTQLVPIVRDGSNGN